MQPSTVYCDTCGAANRPQARFCIACGQAMAAASSLAPTVQAAPIAPSLPATVLEGSTSSSPSQTGLLPAHSLLNQRYLILNRLGQGGMGVVYKAADTQLGDRLVAIKEMSQKGLDPQEVAEAAVAFKREALMLAGLFQRHLPRIYDHFADAGRWYLVMDFIAGETLEEHLVKAGGKLPVEQVLDIGIQLAMVLDYLHSHRPPIIFRDLKPANIMRMPDGDLFLIDFGIARLFKAGQAKDTIAYGSAGYAAPEQYGKVQTTPQSDIYSLGATLHHLLSGTDPSQSPFIFAPLSGAGIPAELGALILRMVKTIANERPSSMDEVKQELQRIQRFAAQPTPSKLPPTLYLTYRGHATNERGGVATLAWSPDGKRIASGSYDKTGQVWDATTGNNLLTYRGHSDAVHTVTWSPDGTRIASRSTDKTVQVWNATTGKRVVTYRRYSDPISALAWSPDGKYLAFSPGRIVQIWNTSTDKLILTYRGYSDPISALVWSPDGTRIASGSTDKTVQVSNTTNGKTIFTYKDTPPVYTLAWSPDGTRIASGGGDKTVQVWQAP